MIFKVQSNPNFSMVLILGVREVKAAELLRSAWLPLTCHWHLVSVKNSQLSVTLHPRLSEQCPISLQALSTQRFLHVACRMERRVHLAQGGLSELSQLHFLQI